MRFKHSYFHMLKRVGGKQPPNTLIAPQNTLTSPVDNIIDKIDKLEITGCFCLTELGYGNNAVMMETTSTYDDTTK